MMFRLSQVHQHGKHVQSKLMYISCAGVMLGTTLACMSTRAKQQEKSKKRPVVVTGPSGVGKGTLIGMLLKEEPSKYNLSTSHTTRKPRPGEVDGVHYYFVTREEFLKGLEEGKFIEYNEYNGNFYGTSVEAIRKVAVQGKTCILDIDVNGAKAVKKTDLEARFFFVMPPGEDPFATLKQRLLGRGTDKPEQIEKRLEIAKDEIEFARSHATFFDHIIVNDDLNETYRKWKELLKSQEDQ